MNNTQFEALYKLATPLARKHECKDALRLVFMEGMGIREAARKTGITFPAVSIAAANMRKTAKTVHAAVTGEEVKEQSDEKLQA